MKVLLDEKLPHDPRHFMHMHQAFTVAYKQWQGLENDDRLARAAGDVFDVLVTKDTNLHYQQNLRDIPIAVVVLRAASNAIDDVRPLVPELLRVLAGLVPRTVTVIG